MNWRYKIKKVVKQPYAWYKRGQEQTDDAFWRAALELHQYSSALYSYAAQKDKEPHMMYDVPLDENSIVLDLGGYVGEWTDKILTRGNPQIHIFEPHPSLCNNLKKKYKNKPNIKVYECGISGSNYDADFYFAHIGSSEYEEIKGEAETGNKMTVKMRDISEIVNELGGKIDLIKINIEGGEYPVMNRLIETGDLDKIKYVYVQFHEWINNSYALRRKIVNGLKKTHDCEWSHYFVWEKWIRKNG